MDQPIDHWQGFDVAVGAWRLGDLAAERLPAAAIGALSSGCDTPSLRVLAGMEGSGWSEVEPVLASVFAERGRELPVKEEALKLVADDLVRTLVEGDMEPQEAVERLRELAWRAVDTPQWDDLDSFVGLAWDWGDEFFDRDELRRVTLQVATDLLERGGLRLG